MTSDWIPITQAKLILIHRYVEELAGLVSVVSTAYAADRPRQLAVERACQLVVECCSDTNALVLAGLGQPPPPTSRDGFASLERQGIFAPELSRLFRETFVGFRNRLVHDYDRTDNQIVFRTAGWLVQAGRDYIAAMGAFLAAVV